jgi:7-cyano-7-deazaguanine synthase
MDKGVILLSGGVDSTVLAYKLASDGVALHAVSYRYGQRHADREIAAASRTAERLYARHSVIELHPRIFAPTALTGFGEVPWLPTTDRDGTKPVVVPGRNTIFLVGAASVATYDDATTVYFAPTKDDITSFADCRPGYLAAINSLLNAAELEPEVIAPFMRMTKQDVVRLGAELGVPWQDTYSCYVGGPRHCGKCGSTRPLPRRRGG